MHNFLQSKKWEELQKAVGRKVWRIGETLVIQHDLPFKKNYLYSPRGPIGLMDEFLNKVKEIAQKEKSIFLKIEPDLNFNQNISNFEKSDKEIQPSKTIVLNISKSEDELLGQMHSKTRYNIRLAQKKGIEIEESQNIDSFIKLLKETARRDKFYLHPDDYYRKIFQNLNGIKLFLAKRGNEIIAGNLVLFFNQEAIYLHGASDHNFRQYMAPYLLQWYSILEAKKNQLIRYDFYGINEIKWPGITRFKKGFGGKEINYSGSYNFVFSSFWYVLYNLIRR